MNTGGHADNSIKLISSDGAKTIETAAGHCAPVTCLSLSNDSNYLVTGSRDTTVIIWRIHRVSLSNAKNVSESTPTAISPTGGSDPNSTLDASRRRRIEGPMHVLRGHLGEIISCSVCSDLGAVASCSNASGVILHSLRRGRLIKKLGIKEAHIVCLSSQGVLLIWNKIKKSLSTFTVNGIPIAKTVISPFSGRISCIQISADGENALIGTSSCTNDTAKDDIVTENNMESDRNDFSNENTKDRIAVPVPSIAFLNLHTLKNSNIRSGCLESKMLDQLLIFTRGGLILWELGSALKGSPIGALIRSCLLEERSADAAFHYDAPGASGGAAYTLKWAFDNDLGLVFVAVYQRIFHLLYVDDLLAAVRREFSRIHDPSRTSYDDFNETFRQLQKEAEARAEEMRKSKQAARIPTAPKKHIPGDGAARGSGKQRNSGSSSKTSGSGKDESDGYSGKGRWLVNGSSNGQGNESKDNSRALSGFLKGKENGAPEVGAFDVNKLHKLRSKGGKKTDTGGVGSKATKAEPKKNVKKNRVWDDSPSESRLDFTNPVDERGEEPPEVVEADQGESMMDKEEIVSSESENEEDEEVENEKPCTKKKGWFSSMFQR
ncbi:hypothetical protein BHM03_00002450 [Ensete ventricosum]|nr:hypothetical protein BHM03_00002450 [Ensete ventricosum]